MEKICLNLATLIAWQIAKEFNESKSTKVNSKQKYLDVIVNLNLFE